MKTFILWRLIDGKKQTLIKINHTSKEYIKNKFKNYKYDGMDVISPCLP